MHQRAFRLLLVSLVWLTASAREKSSGDKPITAEDPNTSNSGKSKPETPKELKDNVLKQIVADSAPKKDDGKPGSDICHPGEKIKKPPTPDPTEAEMNALFKRRQDIKDLKDAIESNDNSKGLVKDAAYVKLEKKIKKGGIMTTLKQFYERYIDNVTPEKKAKVVQWGGYTQAYWKQSQLETDMKRRVLVFGDNTLHIGGLSCAQGFGVFEKFAKEYRKNEGWKNVIIGGIVSSAGLNPEWIEDGWTDDLDFGIIIPQIHNNIQDGKEDWVTRFILQKDLNNPETYTGDIIQRAALKATPDFKAYQLFYQGGEIAYKEGLSMIHKMTAEPHKYPNFQMELHSSWEQVDPEKLKKQIEAKTCDPTNPPMKQKGAEKLYNTAHAIQMEEYLFDDAGAWEEVLNKAKHREGKKETMKKAAAKWASRIQICFQMKMKENDFDCKNEAERGWVYFLEECEDCKRKNECWCLKDCSKNKLKQQ